jgi:predicted oxidoreductase
VKGYRIPNTDLMVSRMAYGCGALGSLCSPKPPGATASKEVVAKYKAGHDKIAIENWQRTPVSAETIAKASRLVNTAFDHGVTLFDHADIYSFGKSEEAFGEVLKQSPALRGKITIQTKCGIHFSEDMYQPRRGDPHRLDFSREHIVSAAEGSLRRLATDHIDILLLHRPDALMEPEEVARAIDDLHSSGKVRYFGVSNHTPAQIELLKKHVTQPLVVNQIQLGLAYSYLIADGLEANQDETTRLTLKYTGVSGILDYCRLRDIQIQAWSPLKGSDMSGGVSKLINPPADAAAEIRQAANMLKDLADEKHTTPPALALAWLMRHPARIVPLIGAAKPEHLIECCDADRITLSRAEWYDLFLTAAGVPSLRLLGIILPKEWS